jgi:hypothetical protein
MHAEPFEDGRQVVADGALTDEERSGDGLHPLAPHQAV